MNLRILGALMLITGCSGFGYYLCLSYHRELALLEQISSLIDRISCELQYRLTPLPQLLRNESSVAHSPLNRFLRNVAGELEAQISPNVLCCTQAALSIQQELPESAKNILLELGTSLGSFDLQGQLTCLSAVQSICRRSIQSLAARQAANTRCTQAYCFCTGIVIALLLL